MMQEHLQEMIQKITKYSVIALPPVALVSLLFSDWLFAMNIALGGVISLLSFRTIAWAVRKFIGVQMAQPAIMGISILKIIAIGIFLGALMIMQLILPVPLLFGFTLVLAIIIWQGIVAVRKAS
jgi:hypothetical protein